MSRVDEELAAQLERSEQATATAQPCVAAKAKPAAVGRAQLGLLIGLLALGGVGLAVVFSGAGAAVWDVPIAELAKKRAEIGNRPVRLEGTLVKGTLTRRDQPCEYRFQMATVSRPAASAERLEVRYPHCTVPDTFRDVPEADVKVSATGRLTPEGHFEATQILAKCPSKYEMKDRQSRGEAAPHRAPAGDKDGAEAARAD